MAATSIIEFEVEWGETDAAGIAFYPNYFRWFDRATHALFRSLGLPLHTLMAQGYSPPLIKVGCRFFSPLRYPEQLRLITSVSEVEERTFQLEHLLYRDDKLVGQGFEQRAWVELGAEGANGKLKAIPIPPDIAAKLRGG